MLSRIVVAFAVMVALALSGGRYRRAPNHRESWDLGCEVVFFPEAPGTEHWNSLSEAGRGRRPIQHLATVCCELSELWFSRRALLGMTST